MLTRRTFVASAAAAAIASPAIRPFTAEAWGGDLNAALRALPDGGTIEGGEWWVDGPIRFTGRYKTLRNLTATFRAGPTARVGTMTRHLISDSAFEWDVRHEGRIGSDGPSA